MKRRSFLKTTTLGAVSISMYPFNACDSRIDRFTNGKYCIQPASDISVIAEVDVLVAGGTIGGVSVACTAAKSGSDVFLAGFSPYPGEDICGTYKFMFDSLEEGSSELGKKLFGNDSTVSPMYIKTMLEKELIDHNVRFLYCSYVSDVIFGDDNQPAGVIISNRTGRQAILCKSIVDCTQGAYLAKLAGAAFNNNSNTSFDEFNFNFISIGSKPKTGEGISVTRLPAPVKVNQSNYHVLEYNISLPLKDFSFGSLAEAEQIIRERVWDPDQVDSSDNPFWQSPYRIKSQGSFREDPENIADIPVQAFLPEQTDNLFVLSSCADVPSETALNIMFPENQIELGKKLGFVASEKASAKRFSDEFFTRPVRGVEHLDGITGEISETLRPNLGTKKIFSEQTALPVLGEYDVLVVGGGTAGAPAAISSARNGAKTLVTEYLHGLGGTSTLGMIGRYWYGNRDGFTKEIDKGVREMGVPSHPRHKERDHEWVKDWKMEWYRREIRKAGGDIWFGVMATGAFVENGKVKGVVIATPEGSGVVLAKQIVDSTGSADIAIAAGAEYEYTGKSTLAVQGSGLPMVAYLTDTVS